MSGDRPTFPSESHSGPCKDLVKAQAELAAQGREIGALTAWVQKIDDARESLSMDTARSFAEIRAQVRMAAFIGSIVGGAIVSLAVGLLLKTLSR